MTSSRPYIPRMPYSWWLKNPNYIRYMLRELTCVWIAAYVVVLVVGLIRLVQGPEQWAGWLHALGTTGGVIFQVLALLFTVYHTMSWFKLAPSTMPVWIGDRQLPPVVIQLAHYIVWLVISVFAIWLVGV